MRVAAVVASLLMVALGAGARVEAAPAAGQPAGTPAPAARVICSPAAPVVAQDTSNAIVKVRAWVGGPHGDALGYQWKVQAGTVVKTGQELEWDLSNLHEGEYRVQLRVLDGAVLLGACSAAVHVYSEDRGRETARDFLPRGVDEVPGYGLYSYLLLGSKPTRMSCKRYLTVLKAYLALESAEEQEAAGYKRSQLNVTYLPVKKTPSAAPRGICGGASQPGPDDSPDEQWLLDHYDWDRASFLLGRVKLTRRNGIYIVSSFRPLTRGGAEVNLMQDLTTVPTEPEDLLTWWLQEFQSQAAQQRYWQPRTVQTLMLNIRTTISALAEGLPDVKQGVKDWIRWVK